MSKSVVQMVLDGSGAADQFALGIKMGELTADANGVVKALGKGFDALDLSKTEVFNNVVIGTDAFTQFRNLTEHLRPIIKQMKAAGVETIDAESVMKFAGKNIDSRVPGKTHFIQDRYKPPEVQVQEALNAIATNTVNAAAKDRANWAMNTAIFPIGTHTLPKPLIDHPWLRIPFRYTSYWGKETNFVWTRLTPTGKLKWMAHSFAVGGVKTLPFIGAAAQAYPQIDRWLGEVADDPTGNHRWRRAIMHMHLIQAINSATGENFEAPTMFNPVGSLPNVPFSNMSTAKSNWGKLVAQAVWLGGPETRVIANSVLPSIESAMYTQRPPGLGPTAEVVGRAFTDQGMRAIPAGASYKDSHNDEAIGLIEQIPAFFGMKQEHVGAMWDRVAALNAALEKNDSAQGMGERAAKRYYTVAYLFNHVANGDLSLAKFSDDINQVDPRVAAARRGLESSGSDLAKSVDKKNEQNDARALSTLGVNKDTAPTALWAIESSIQRIIDTKGKDSKSAYMVKVGMPLALRAFEVAENDANANGLDEQAARYRAAQVHMEARLKDVRKTGFFGPDDISRLPPARPTHDRPATFDANQFLRREIARLPPGMGEKELEAALRQKASSLIPATQRKVYAYVNGYVTTGDGDGLKRLQQNMLWDGKK